MVRNLQIWLRISQDLALLPCEVGNTDAMFKPAMASGREHLVAKAELFEVLQALKRRRVDYLPATFRKKLAGKLESSKLEHSRRCGNLESSRQTETY